MSIYTTPLSRINASDLQELLTEGAVEKLYAVPITVVRWDGGTRHRGCAGSLGKAATR